MHLEKGLATLACFSPGMLSAMPLSMGLVANCSRPCRIFSGSVSTDWTSSMILAPSPDCIIFITSAIFSCISSGFEAMLATSSIIALVSNPPASPRFFIISDMASIGLPPSCIISESASIGFAASAA